MARVRKTNPYVLLASLVLPALFVNCSRAESVSGASSTVGSKDSNVLAGTAWEGCRLTMQIGDKAIYEKDEITFTEDGKFIIEGKSFARDEKCQEIMPDSEVKADFPVHGAKRGKTVLGYRVGVKVDAEGTYPIDVLYGSDAAGTNVYTTMKIDAGKLYVSDDCNYGDILSQGCTEITGRGPDNRANRLEQGAFLFVFSSVQK